MPDPQSLSATAESPDALTQAVTAASPVCLARSVLSAARSLTRVYNAFLHDTGLQITQFTIMAAFALDRYHTLAHLADVLALERTTLLRNIDLLRRAGLVIERQRPAGNAARSAGRSKRFDLTPAGRAALEGALPAWEKAQQAFGAALGEEEMAAMRDALRRLRRAADGIADARRETRADDPPPEQEHSPE
jgi:DNA-binding MarR family transcriptional regulator